ncbi:response regulator [Limnoraphis robusta]|uniref:Response regulator n=1 Tax=Limnoraphis robusta CCNP1315 TaxID=3110306 RepID=A0ABU5TWG1_9CYAN|nr:response regulator [Limnoraphis robusta]MEA5497622.1 response regulator [Limnoraphis robusta BA-68 BA1]MEA5519154.1 response regulator [Limnoraphis robusta CCNP1315]MEA5548137.1 response regulator [Limnoraphis robusta CCNP1324]
MPKPVILCVDDEPVVLDSLKIQLKNAFRDTYGYEMAESSDEAWEILEELSEDNTNVVVIVSDWLMPGMKGDEFLIKVHQKFPNVLKIMLTGQADMEAIQQAIEQANLYRCLSKPWNSEELIATIESGLKNYQHYQDYE